MSSKSLIGFLSKYGIQSDELYYILKYGNKGLTIQDWSNFLDKIIIEKNDKLIIKSLVGLVSTFDGSVNQV